jgi:HEAT repeat protein
VPAILQCLHRTQDDWRRSVVIRGIQSIGPAATTAIPDLLACATGSSSHTTQAALAALRTFGAALVPHLPRLAELARDPTLKDWRSNFAELFTDLAKHTTGVLDPLRKLLRSALPAEKDDWNVRWSKKSTRECVLRGFTVLGSAAGAAISDLAPLVADPEVEVRRLVVHVLGTIGTSAAVVPLCRALTDTDDVVRVRAAEALAEQTDTSDETIAALVHAVGDREAKVRRAAVDALNKLKLATDAVRAALAEAVRDDDKKVAERAAIALRKVTPKEVKTLTKKEPKAKAEPKTPAEPKAKVPTTKGKKKPT